MDVSISIVSWNTRGLLDQCLESVFSTAQGIEFEVIVVDNASSDGSVEMVREKYPHVKVIANNDNIGFAKANNQALQGSTGRHFLLLNPDTVCLPEFFDRLVRFLDDHPKVGAVGSLVRNTDHTLQYSWAKFPTFMNEVLGWLDRRVGRERQQPRTAEATIAMGPFRTDWVGGCCLMIRREAANAIGPMDEALFMYSEETDWCYRLHMKGWEIWVEPSAEIVHFGGASSSQAPLRTALILRQSKAAYFRKHHGRVAGCSLSLVLAAKAYCRSTFNMIRKRADPRRG